MSLSDRLRQLARAYRDFYELPMRRAVALEQRRREDFLRLLLMSESLGLPNPAAWYCLELMPFVIEDYHAWHRRMGMEHAPPGGIGCC